MGLLDGKVVLVTGAGGGIGRCHALACAKEGARIVVNDLGGSRDGTGAGSSMADKVVEEIKAMGGDAIADHASVTDADACRAMVKAALDKWGRLDCVVNNAGILRDKSFAKMTDLEWDAVIAVHLAGTKNVCAASFEAIKASSGSFVNTTSYSGMIGNFGQSNYAAAKAGIYGMTRVLALEMQKSGARANCVAPVAKTRMTDDIAMVAEDWKPEQISPIVVFLASDLSKGVTGRVFGVQGQRIHLYEVKVNDGVEKPGADLWTAQEISEKLQDIMRFETAGAASPLNAAEVDVVKHAFTFFPVGYKKGSAPGWKANIQWVIAGGTDHTVTIDNDECKVAVGLVGTPTCTVKSSKDIVVALLKREMDPQKVFLTGKATADNMGDLMKMAMSFDFEKMGKAIAQAGAGAAPAKPAAPVADVVSLVFAQFPSGFKPEGAAGWNAVLHWKVKDGSDQTVTVSGGKCTVEKGLVGTATCSVKVDNETLIAMFTGKLDAQKAFMSGKASADNIGDLMKMAMAFDFKKVEAAFKAAHPELASGAPAAAAPAAAAPAKDKTLPLGKRYDGGFAQISREAFQAYAKATDDENPAYFGAEAVAPPMFHVQPFFQMMMKLATDPALELDLLRLVHAEHDVSFKKPLRHGDVLQIRGTLESVEDKSSGRLVRYGLLGFVDGQVAVEGRTSYFIRGQKKAEGGEAKSEAAEAPPAPTWTVSEMIGVDQPKRYAEASGDHNPIHLDAVTAKAAGLPGVIAHGLNTMALAQRDLIAKACGGDPRRLKRLAVRWAKPVFPGTKLTLKVWDKGDGIYEFVTEGEGGVAVVTNGRAVVA